MSAFYQIWVLQLGYPLGIRGQATRSSVEPLKAVDRREAKERELKRTLREEKINPKFPNQNTRSLYGYLCALISNHIFTTVANTGFFNFQTPRNARANHSSIQIITHSSCSNNLLKRIYRLIHRVDIVHLVRSRILQPPKRTIDRWVEHTRLCPSKQIVRRT